MNRSPETGLEDFLTELALVSDVDEVEEKEQAIVFMTLHSAKGLEYPVVFLSGMDEGIFPHSRSLLDDEQLEEERRLCYVGITRARKKLYLTRAWQRTIYGNKSYYMASRFLNEIPPEYITEISSDMGNNTTSGSQKFATDKEHGTSFHRNNVPSGNVGLGPGDRVKHTKWGEGTVIDIDGIDEEMQISINFPSVGEKHLILKYAPIIKI